MDFMGLQGTPKDSEGLNSVVSPLRRRRRRRRRRSDREMSRTAPVVCPAPCFTTDGVDETAIPEEAMSSADPR